MDETTHDCLAGDRNLHSGDHLDASDLQITRVGFEVDEDLNGEVSGASMYMEGRAADGNEMEESSDEVSGEEPYLGQEFESEAAAHAFYNTYATRLGFVIRVSKLSRSRRDGTAIGRALVCNKEGFRMPDRREKIVRQRAETRVGCRAMILVRKASDGKWIVTKFVKEHTHTLTPGKGRRELMYDQYPNEHDKIKELSQQLAIEKKRAASYKRQLELVFEHIEEHNKCLSNNIQDIVNSVKEMESKEHWNGTQLETSRGKRKPS
ncbi:FAR1 domain-containing protein [Heracleum sosnowskyi]|uniref:FAR1 domain-containing protein n=1 Tax=Heracleum sosnowskyi TaxID=360622 RepID=A0AAD8NAW2_9APIA|nr:FAR1 domain-containing protein [Heracleum sosnowskyi]